MYVPIWNRYRRKMYLTYKVVSVIVFLVSAKTMVWPTFRIFFFLLFSVLVHQRSFFFCFAPFFCFLAELRLKFVVHNRNRNANFGRPFADLDGLSRCINCGKRYKYKFNLTRHIRYECGVAPQFSCPECGRSFSQKSSLKSHRGIIHGKIWK